MIMLDYIYLVLYFNAPFVVTHHVTSVVSETTELITNDITLKQH